MDLPDWIGQALPEILPLVGLQELLVLVDMAGNDIEVEPLRRLRLAIHEQRERFRRRVAQPFIDS